MNIKKWLSFRIETVESEISLLRIKIDEWNEFKR